MPLAVKGYCSCPPPTTSSKCLFTFQFVVSKQQVVHLSVSLFFCRDFTVLSLDSSWKVRREEPLKLKIIYKTKSYDGNKLVKLGSAFEETV